jgi:hypothetical protein
MTYYALLGMLFLYSSASYALIMFPNVPIFYFDWWWSCLESSHSKQLVILVSLATNLYARPKREKTAGQQLLHPIIYCTCMRTPPEVLYIKVIG